MNLPDNKIIQAISNDNQKVFNDLFKFYYQGLCLFANSYFRDLEMAEEIVQDVFVKIWEKRKHLPEITTIKTYLYTSVKNSCIDKVRKDQVRKKYADEVQNENSISLDFDFMPDNEIIKEIKKAVKKLPKQRRKIFQMNRYLGFKYKEIASKLKLSPKTVENQMGLALKQLREMLKDYIPVLVILALCF